MSSQTTGALVGQLFTDAQAKDIKDSVFNIMNLIPLFILFSLKSVILSTVSNTKQTISTIIIKKYFPICTTFTSMLHSSYIEKRL